MLANPWVMLLASAILLAVGLRMKVPDRQESPEVIFIRGAQVLAIVTGVSGFLVALKVFDSR
jgi:hypothetical protein